MSDWREPETYNSQDLVSKADSLNSSHANLIDQSGLDLDSSLDSSFELSVPQLFLATSNGLHPSLVTKMFQSSKSVKQLTQFLTSIFSHGLKTGQVNVSLSLAKQFRPHKYFPTAVVNSVSLLAQSHVRVSLMGNLVALIKAVYQMLGPGKDILTPVLVDTLVKWVSPLQDRKKEVTMTTSAMNIILNAGPEIGLSSPSGYRLVFAQVRAGLLGEGLMVESRAVLLDMLVIMSRQGMPGEGGMFFVEYDQKNDQENSVENKNETITGQVKIGNIEKDVLGYVEEIKTTAQEQEKDLLLKAGFVCSFAEDVENLKSTIKKDYDEMAVVAEKNKKAEVYQQYEPEKLQLLLTPAMFEETASEVAPSASDVHPTLLGHFIVLDTEAVYSVYDNECSIGRDSSCSIMLPGKEVSRLHARVTVSEGKVTMESVSKTNNIRINGVAVNKAVTLMNGDRIHVGRELMTWHREGAKQQEQVSEDTLWGEKDSSENCVVLDMGVCAAVEEEEIEAAHDRYLEYCGEEVTEKVVSDAESVVVEMVNFI